MEKTLKEVESVALQLPLKERAVLAKHLLETLDQEGEEDVEAFWSAEGERRYAEYKAGRIAAKPAQEVFEALSQNLK